ncbi:3-hydroxyacyl-CoA dehydrogenase family protein [Mycobacterium sp. NAZ190054]|uniref:3-hydroxyacyl-CoA dehydrogenase family protein n=1 Tax=Mycobacterium sp. NAZ190054 TaxID=1747766 RepID=UPI0007980C08|nr:3-hydroxyacyl-CoA dehydrogenase family protein [Mycobacterium sp. NAZ190054]KWX68522.1 3-hydroxybutyryl-CoA dehydrogenase [Mycobacterium sp. NAZ190054]
MHATLPTHLTDRPVAVIGAGTLGRRIAAVFSAAGSAVRIADIDASQRDGALRYITEEVPALAARSGRTPGEVSTGADVETAVPGAWLVIEAVPERLDIKRPLFGALDRVADSDAILATNSSSYASRLVVDEVAHRNRVLNMHFAMPPQNMAVELMSDGETDPAVIEFLVARLPDFGLLPFVARRESTGFIFNRIWAAIKRESLEVVAAGVSTPQEVDAIMVANLAIAEGPFRLMDRVGLDIVLDIEEHYAAENPYLPIGPRRLLHEYVDSGRLGVKAGEGFYKWPGDAAVCDNPTSG